MQRHYQNLRAQLIWILVFVGIIWLVFLLSLAVPSIKAFGLVPRTLVGLVGIPSMPLLHKDLFHLLSNTVPLIVLLSLLVGSRARSWEIVVAIVGLGGVLLWLFGRPSIHIGASSLIFGLVTFLLLSGFLERRIIPLFVSLAVGFLYGTTLLWGVLPRFGSEISWDGHLMGAIAGAIVAYVLTREPRSKPTIHIDQSR